MRPRSLVAVTAITLAALCLAGLVAVQRSSGSLQGTLSLQVTSVDQCATAENLDDHNLSADCLAEYLSDGLVLSASKGETSEIQSRIDAVLAHPQLRVDCHESSHRAVYRALGKGAEWQSISVVAEALPGCEAGIIHGAFDALAVVEPNDTDFVRYSYRCAQVEIARSDISCFIPVGHAAYHMTGSIPGALVKCDLLDFEIENMRSYPYAAQSDCALGAVMERWLPGIPPADGYEKMDVEETFRYCAAPGLQKGTRDGCYRGVGYNLAAIISFYDGPIRRLSPTDYVTIAPEVAQSVAECTKTTDITGRDLCFHRFYILLYRKMVSLPDLPLSADIVCPPLGSSNEAFCRRDFIDPIGPR